MKTAPFSLNASKKFYLFILSYYFIQILLRAFLSNSFDMDGTEEILWSQKFLWGYNAQPPLYRWCMIPFFHTFGYTTFTLALFKNMLLVLGFVFFFKSCKLLLLNEKIATVASLSFFLIPEIAWESQTDRATSVMVFSVSIISFYIFLKLISTGKLRYYFLCGIVVGLGILSKYNYILFAFSLFLAALTIPKFRRLILDKYIIFTFIVAFLIICPHAIWFVTHISKATTTTLGKFHIATHYRFIGLFKGFLSILRESVLFLSPLWLFYLIFIPCGYKSIIKNRVGLIGTCNLSSQIDRNDIGKLIERLFLIVYICLIILVIFFGVTHFKARWFSSFLFLFPIYFFIRLKKEDLKIKPIYWLKRTAVAFSILVYILLFGRVYFAAHLKKICRPNYPFSEIATILKKRQHFKTDQLVISDSQLIAGNLKVDLKTDLALTPETVAVSAGRNRQKYTQILLIWSKNRKVPNNILALAKLYIDKDIKHMKPAIVVAPYKHTRNRRYALNYLIIEK